VLGLEVVELRARAQREEGCAGEEQGHRRDEVRRR